MLVGIVDLHEFELKLMDMPDQVIKVRRTSDNKRSRPNGHVRHDPNNYGKSNENDNQKFISPTNLEWMSLNYRKEKAAKLSPSRRRMILVMLETNFKYFPTLLEIRNELISAQMNQIEIASKEWNNHTQFDFMKKSYARKWSMLFNIAKLG